MTDFEFKKLTLKDYPKLQERETNEARYWKAFNWNKEVVLQAAPNCIDFNPANDNQYIVTSSLKVHLFEGSNDKIQRSYSRFTDDAYSGKFRKDGKLIVAGDKIGQIKVFDFQTKSLLRQLKHHTGAVRSTRWSASGLNILSGSDDKKINVTDLATGEILWSNKTQHLDYIRSITAHPDDSNLFLSGSYDRTLAFWDTRQVAPIWNVNHGHPIEASLITASGSIAITAGGNEVKLWDILSGGKLLHTFNNHQKNITSICFDGHQSRLLSSGLDGHVKIYSLNTLSVIHGLKFDAPLMNVGINAQNKKLIVGFVSGNLLIKNRKEKVLPETTSSSQLSGKKREILDIEPLNLNEVEDLSNLNWFDMTRRKRLYKGTGMNYSSAHSQGANLLNSSGQLLDASSNNILLETERHKKLQLYEKHLQKFNYQLALDSALATRNVIVIVTVLDELCRRNGLTIALSGRDEVTLEPLLQFLIQYIIHPRYSQFLIQITHRVIDIYYSIIGYSPMIDSLFQKLLQNVQQEMVFQKDIMRVMGSIDCVINVSTMPKRQKIDDEVLPTIVSNVNEDSK
jgi:U3 small nucleolar RNA-associated protein 15